MNNQKTLTISIAAYNVEKYITRALESLLIDELDKLEVLIIDDGSSDQTSNIAQSYCKKYPNTFKLIQKENGGYGSTINVSIRQASSKYFRVLDSDDYFIKENLKEYLLFLENNNTDVILSPYIEVDDNGNEIALRDRHSPSRIDSFRMHEIAVKTSILKENDIHITEKCFYTDIEYAFMVSLYTSSITLYPQIIYAYRLGDANQSVGVLGRRKHPDDAKKITYKSLDTYLSFEKELNDSKRDNLLRIIAEISQCQIVTYLIVEDKKYGKASLKDFDTTIKKSCHTLYMLIQENSNLIKMLRITNYNTYSIGRKYEFNKLHYEE